jgi:hypothetical protein
LLLRVTVTEDSWTPNEKEPGHDGFGIAQQGTGNLEMTFEHTLDPK